MAMASTRKQCSISTCNQEKGTCDCNGCSTTFCSDHYAEHHQSLGTIRHQIEYDYNLLLEALRDRKNNLTLEIDQQIEESITNFKQMIEQWREKSIEYRNQVIMRIENQLTNLYRVLQQSGKENQIDEIELNQTKEKLERLRNELDTISNVPIERECTPSTTKISLNILFHRGNKIIKSIYKKIFFFSFG